jgi:hypothetical protein
MATLGLRLAGDACRLEKRLIFATRKKIISIKSKITNHEENISAFKQEKEEQARLPHKDVDCKRS